MMGDFSLSTNLLKDILKVAKPFGHNEKTRELNIGFGFMYYGIVRALRPDHVLVIGSGYGFSVVCLALGLKDNGRGRLSFVDPAYSLLKNGPLMTVGGRGVWTDESHVKAHFGHFGVENLVTHYKMRSDEFFPSFQDLKLPPINLAFIDGSHAYKDVKYDFIKVLEQSHKNTYIFLHDTNIYLLKFVKREEASFEVIDFPFSSGVALVRVVDPSAWKRLH